MNWLCGTNSYIVTLMKYDGNGIEDFSDHGPIFCTAYPGETFASIMKRYNTWRSPGTEFRYVWDMSGNKLSPDTRIQANITIVVGWKEGLDPSNIVHK
jgi:hypothetical protein